jgi:hypothetical protein
MSVQVMKLVFEALLPDAETKLVALRLADFANRDGTSIFPSVATIVSDTLLSARTVQRRLKVLIALRVLRLEPRHRGRRTNCYAFDLDALRALGASGCRRAIGGPATCRNDGAGASPGRGEGDRVTPNPSVNHHLTVSVATRAGIDDLQDRLIAAAGDAVDAPRVRRSSTAPVQSWLKDGLGLEEDILPAIAAKARTLCAGKVKSWLFFDGPIRDWQAQRSGVRRAHAQKRSPETFTQSDWNQRLEHYATTGRWHDAWGPEPGEAGCLAPAHLLAERNTA